MTEGHPKFQNKLGGCSDLPVLLVLTSTYPRWRGDPEPAFVHELSRRLVGRFRVVLVGPSAPGAKAREKFDGVEVYRYRYAPARWETLVNDGGIITNLKRQKWKWILVPSFLFMQFWVAWRVARQEKVDVIHAHWLLPQGLIAFALQVLLARRPPFVVTSHGADLYALNNHLLRWLKKIVVGAASVVTVVSSAMRERLYSYGVDLEKIRVQPMGVDLRTVFTPDSAIERSAREILFVGRLVEKKGLSYLLDAMPYILDQHPDCKLTIVGFGPERATLETQVEELRIGSSVQFVGSVVQSRLPDLYRRAAVFVAPFVRAESGDQEGLGLVLVEAIGCGCPVIVGDVCAVRDVVGDRYPYYVDPRDTAHMATAISDVLRDPEPANSEIKLLQVDVLERLDWRSVATAYAELLLRSDGQRSRH